MAGRARGCENVEMAVDMTQNLVTTVEALAFLKPLEKTRERKKIRNELF